ncbi:hypothetical protein FisN_6Lh278 [Fistulifera solaris]|uniref:Phospholipid scramblase n=1 Tax=Fistulifera solaris TaxID=1519565 RepID=A0A1Z5J6F5_FISSO|nr:hypothetical protein FisN_6Lh278 [Fistulifera solaris]|eukprot:GAX09351.1 hypothetical protein FisN_6Lh278 [Fistulifera solaris]
MVHHSTPFPTLRDYEYVHNVTGPIFTDRVMPSSEPQHIYRLRMREKMWTSWSGDSYGIQYRDGTPFEVDIKGQVLTLRDRMILRDSKGNVVGVMLRMFLRLQQTFKIYGLRPFKDSQAPSDQMFEGKALYTWAEVVEKFMSVQRIMTMADGTRYVADQVGSFLGPQHLRLTYNGRVCASARQLNWAADFGGTSWDLTIGPGVDPCLICCFIAVIDEMKENRKNETNLGCALSLLLAGAALEM